MGPRSWQTRTSLPAEAPGREGALALLSINIDTDTGEAVEEVHTAALSAARPPHQGRLDEGLSRPDPQAEDRDGKVCALATLCGGVTGAGRRVPGWSWDSGEGVEVDTETEAHGHGEQRYVHTYSSGRAGDGGMGVEGGRASRGPGGRRKGGSGNAGSPAQGDREEKGTRMRTPNHADKTQPGQHGTAGPGGGPGFWDSSTQILQGDPGVSPPPPLLGGFPPLQSQWEKKQQNHGASSFTRVYAFRNNFLESSLFSQGAAVVLARPAPALSAHTEQEGGTQRSQGPGRGGPGPLA